MTLGGLPPAVRISEPLRAAAGADPLLDVEAMPSADVRGPAGPSGFHASRGSDEDGSPFDIVIEPEPIVGAGGITDPSPAERPARSTREPGNLDDDLHRRVDGIDIPHEVCTEGPELPQDSGEAIVVGAVGSATPWFLTGWAEGVEVDFMIVCHCRRNCRVVRPGDVGV